MSDTTRTGRRRIARRDRADEPLGSALLGAPSQSREQLRLRLQLLLTTLLLAANATGMAVVVVLIAWAIPGPDLFDPMYTHAVYLTVPLYVVAAVTVGTIAGTKLALRCLRWVREERTPDDNERVAALALPWRLTLLQLALWGGGVLVLGIGFGVVDYHAVPKVTLTVAFVGAAVAAFSFVLSEFALRPISARALHSGDPRRLRINGVRRRTVLAWMLGTAIPVSGLVIIAAFYFTRPVTATQLASSILTLGSITLVFGLLLTVIGARATVDPIRSVITAMGKIERDEPNTTVAVYDGTELGELQSGFNRMAAGLRERERIRELFGWHVGTDVADEALRRNPELGGEERTIAVFFIDLVGSTQIAFSRPPKEVVQLLNRFFDVVVDEVDKHRGIINKFEGDAALAIFGAPADIPDAAGCALAAARAIHRRLPQEVSEIDAAIGVAYGVAVAGNIGARKRFEYTVIGDPVNEAARLCEKAKDVSGLVLASERTVDAADSAEAQRWELGDTVTLRGRSEQTRLAHPR